MFYLARYIWMSYGLDSGQPCIDGDGASMGCAICFTARAKAKIKYGVLLK